MYTCTHIARRKQTTSTKVRSVWAKRNTVTDNAWASCDFPQTKLLSTFWRKLKTMGICFTKLSAAYDHVKCLSDQTDHLCCILSYFKCLQSLDNNMSLIFARTYATIKPHVPMIKFRKGGLNLTSVTSPATPEQQTAPVTAAGTKHKGLNRLGSYRIRRTILLEPYILEEQLRNY